MKSLENALPFLYAQNNQILTTLQLRTQWVY